MLKKLGAIAIMLSANLALGSMTLEEQMTGFYESNNLMSIVEIKSAQDGKFKVYIETFNSEVPCYLEDKEFEPSAHEGTISAIFPSVDPDGYESAINMCHISIQSKHDSKAVGVSTEGDCSRFCEGAGGSLDAETVHLKWR